MKKILLLLVLFFTSCSAYAGIDINYDDGIYHIALTGEKIKKRISFISSEGLITNKEAHQRTKSKLTVNAGYFDPKNEKSISYIVTDRNTAEDPLLNQSLFENPILRRNVDKILNRTEFRIVECSDGKRHY